MHTGGECNDSMDEQVLDWFISQLDTVNGRTPLLFVAMLTVVTAGSQLAGGDISVIRAIFWLFVVTGNLAIIYTLTMYQKPSHEIERVVLSD